MSIRIGINGFGRIGRLVFRAGIVRDDVEIVAVNAPDKTPEQLAYATKYDSVHGRFNGTVEVVDGNLVVNGKNVKLLNSRDPSQLPWGELGVDYVLECTGKFLTKEAAQPHLDAGAKVVVCAGFLQEAALRTAAINNPDVNFVFIDGYPLTENPDDPEAAVLTNVAGINFQEEQCGYLAGYAIVKEGFTKIGFSGGGGGSNPACCRYGYGYLQGASAAAAEMGVTVDVMYSWQYGGAFQASPELQTMINGWYTNGTEVVFACGGSMFSSITAAAAANDGIVIGVDVDQSPLSDTVITSALKGISQAAQVALGHHYDGTWSEIGGVQTTLGANDDAVGLPTATWSMENYTVEEYEAQLQAMKDGTLVVDANYPVDESGMDAAATLNGVLPNINITVV